MLEVYPSTDRDGFDVDPERGFLPSVDPLRRLPPGFDVWGEREPAACLPAVIAVPWYAVSKRLGRPPVLSYASYALDNWRRLDPEGPIAVGNLALLQNFLAGLDEEWFVTIHVQIEQQAAAALSVLSMAQAAASGGDAPGLLGALTTIAEALERTH